MKLLDYRKLNNLTQERIAWNLGMSQSNYSLIETGRKQAGIRLVNRIIAETSGHVGYMELRPDIYNQIMVGVEG